MVGVRAIWDGIRAVLLRIQAVQIKLQAISSNFQAVEQDFQATLRSYFGWADQIILYALIIYTARSYFAQIAHKCLKAIIKTKTRS